VKKAQSGETSKEIPNRLAGFELESQKGTTFSQH
jgi:hypothetical protein